MQTDLKMSYSGSSYFSDQNSYEKHFISSYSLRDMIIARYTYFLEFSEKGNMQGKLGWT
jgi:hypothetical protein